jgi:multidrug efflux pump subunit AcrB
MNGVINWFARNSVAANSLMVMLVVSGGFATFSVTSEVFPEFSLDMVTIEVAYLGAAPEEVESAVSVRIKEAIQGIDGIKQITSTASEGMGMGMGMVQVELELGADARKVVDDIKSNVDAITTFPIETEKPIIRELTTRQRVVDVAVSGATDELTLKRVAERVRDDLTAIPAITQAEVTGARPYEISIEVSETALRRHALRFDDVAEAVRRSSLDLPGGSVRAESGEILLRTIGQAYVREDYEDLVIMTRADGTRLRLADVADVVDGFAETDESARFDVAPAVLVSVYRTGDQRVLEVAAAVEEYVENARHRCPRGSS